MSVEIDQSGKIEDTARDTVLAASNGEKHSVIIFARDKRKLQEKFRLAGKPELFVYAVFATVLYFLVKLLKNKRVVVDIEYFGKTDTIQKMVTALNKEINTEWKLIGKNSPAHDLAYKILKGKLKADRRLLTEDIWLKATKITGGRLKIGLSPTNRRSAPVNNKYVITKRKKVK